MVKFIYFSEMLYSHGPSVLPASYSSPSRHPSSNSTTSVNLHNNFSPSLPVEETKIGYFIINCIVSFIKYNNSYNNSYVFKIILTLTDKLVKI